MNNRCKLLSYKALMIVGLILFMTAPQIQCQKLRNRARNSKTGMITWSEWKPLPCERCSGEKTTDCGTCSGGRKKLAVKCGECKGKKKAACRDCYGTGKYVDPFLLTRCTRCYARRAIFCPACGGKGHLVYTNGKKGPNCKVCKKKGSFKCWICKSKGNLALSQIKGAAYQSATESQLKKKRSELKPVFDKLNAFTGVNEDKPKRFFRENDFNDAMKAMAALFPQYKNDIKQVKKLSTAALKFRLLNNYKKSPGKFRETAARAAANFLGVHLNIIDTCLNVISNNRKQAKRNKERKPAPGNGENNR